MARGVSRPSTYGLCTASGMRMSSANIRSSAPRMRSSLFHIPVELLSDLADDRLAEERLALEDLDQAHHREDAHRHRQLDQGDVDAEHVDGLRRDGRGKRPVVAPPDVLGHREEEEAEDDGEQDPALALLLQREP